VRLTWSAALFNRGEYAADLECTTDLVKGVAVIAHELSGPGDVTELLGQWQQGELPLGILRERSYLGTSDSWWFGVPETLATAQPAPALRDGGASAATVGKMQTASHLALLGRNP
jgi:hypothetical protein